MTTKPYIAPFVLAAEHKAEKWRDPQTLSGFWTSREAPNLGRKIIGARTGVTFYRIGSTWYATNGRAPDDAEHWVGGGYQSPMSLAELDALLAQGLITQEVYDEATDLELDIAPTALSSGSIVGSPSLLAGPVGITASAIASGSSITTPNLDSVATIQVSAIASGSAIGSPVVSTSAGAQGITATPISSGSSVAVPSLAPGSVGITATPISSGSSITTPTVGSPATDTAPHILLENGDILALENGDHLIDEWDYILLEGGADYLLLEGGTDYLALEV